MDQSTFGGYFTTLLGGDEEAERTLAEWLKGMIETPEIKPNKAIALVGPPGCGKNSVPQLLRKMLGGGAVLRMTALGYDVGGRVFGDRRMENALVVCIGERPLIDIEQGPLKAIIEDNHISVNERYQPQRIVRSFHRVMLTGHSAIPGFHRHLDQIQCHRPAGDAAAHFNTFYAMLDQATPDDLRHAVLSYAAYLNRPRGWKALRAHWRARWIGVYWHALTEKHMAPGGKMAKRDRAAYEAD